LAVWIIWMRQVLAMKPLASAMRYGPFLAGYWKNFVSLVHGTKQSGSAGGPDTTFGPAALAVRAMPQIMETLTSRQSFFLTDCMSSFLPIVGGWGLAVLIPPPSWRTRWCGHGLGPTTI